MEAEGLWAEVDRQSWLAGLAQGGNRLEGDPHLVLLPLEAVPSSPRHWRVQLCLVVASVD